MSASPEIIAKMTASPCSDESCLLSQGNCYEGQWTVHPPHHYEILRQEFHGGGTRIIHCPGKTEETKL